MRETFFQLCVYFTICMIAVSIFVSIIAGFGFFGDIGEVEQVTEIDTDGSAWSFIVTSIMGREEGGLWEFVLLGAGVLGAVGVFILGIVTGGNSQIIGTYIFSVTFWASYGVMIDITKLGNILPHSIIFGATCLLIVLFIGALIGLLTGNG